MLLRKLDAWFYGIEQRIAKRKRSRTPEYREGQRARREGRAQWRNPHTHWSEAYHLWDDGWIAEDQRS